MTAAGMPEPQAEEVTSLFRQARDIDLGSLATHIDLQLLEQRMTIKLGGLIVAATGLLLAAIRYLPSH